VDGAVLRILDANLNRAREALRVMEEYARFVLEDGGLSAVLKETRHRLAAAVPGPLNDALLAHREVQGDVGRELSTPREFDRAGVHEVARAAGKRLGESLRTIEEYAKTLDRAFAEQIESLRYRAYEIEQRLLMHGPAAQRFGSVRLYVLVTEAVCLGGWLQCAVAALDGGADALQLREKRLTDGELLRRAKRLTALCRERGALCLINDRPDIAALSNAHGVHVGQEDVPLAAVRRLLPYGSVLGISSRTLDQAEVAVSQAPDYLAVGPMFASTTKPAEQVAGVTLLADVRQITSLPLIAIGGIHERNVQDVLEAGPCGVAVCEAVVGQPDVCAAASRLRAIISEFSKPA